MKLHGETERGESVFSCTVREFRMLPFVFPDTRNLGHFVLKRRGNKNYNSKRDFLPVLSWNHFTNGGMHLFVIKLSQ